MRNSQHSQRFTYAMRRCRHVSWVADSGLDVYAHNIETVEELQVQ